MTGACHCTQPLVKIGGLTKFLCGLPSNLHLPISASQVVRITCMSHQHPHYWEFHNKFVKIVGIYFFFHCWGSNSSLTYARQELTHWLTSPPAQSGCYIAHWSKFLFNWFDLMVLLIYLIISNIGPFWKKMNWFFKYKCVKHFYQVRLDDFLNL
jgi:hypothetical protein